MRTLREEAYGRITEKLKSGALKPGSVVSQRELVDRTGSTLAAVREAVPRLEAEGLLKPLRNRGLMVPTVDIRFVHDACGLRRVLELEAVREAPDRIERMTIESWEREHLKYLKEFEKSASPDIVERVQSVDWDLHQALVDSLGNTLISGVYRVNAIKIRMANLARLRTTARNVVRILNEHLSFLTALKAGDVDTACEAMDLHLRNAMTLALGGDV
ncbi:MAG: GntR family transcriptional regulator [Paracoccaceae bacterium]